MANQRHVGDGRVRFGDFEMDLDSFELWRDGVFIPLAPKPGQALALLVRGGGRLVRRQDLYEALWSSTGVELEQGLNAVVRQVRLVLEDDANAPRYVQTVPRRGYRLIPKVEPVEPVAAGRRSRLSRGGIIAAVGVLLITGWVGTRRRPAATVASAGAASTSAGFALSDSLRTLALSARHLVQRETPEDARRALPMLERVLAIHPTHPQTLVDHATGLLRVGRSAEAREQVATTLAVAPEYGPAWELEGTILIREWRLAAAREAFERAVRYNPEVARHHHSLAYALALEGRHDEARFAIREAERIDPVSPAVRGDAGLFAYWAGRHEDALRQCRFAQHLVEPPFELFPVRCLIESHAALAAFDSARASADAILSAAGLDEGARRSVHTSGHGLAGYRRWSAMPENVGWAYGTSTAFTRALAAVQTGDYEASLEALQRAFEGREPRLLQMLVAPQFDPVRPDPRFEAIRAALLDSVGPGAPSLQPPTNSSPQ